MNELRTCDGNAFCSFCLASLSCTNTKPPLKLFLCRSFSAQCEVTNQRIKTFDGLQYQHNIAGKCPYVLVQEHSNDKESKRVEVRYRLLRSFQTILRLLRLRLGQNSCRSAQWDCFGKAIISLTGYYKVAQETRKQAHSAIRKSTYQVSIAS